MGHGTLRRGRADSGRLLRAERQGNNLVRVDGKTWKGDPVVQRASAEVGSGRARSWQGIWRGRSTLGFRAPAARRLWSRAKITVNNYLYADAPSPSYRDLELDG